MPTVSISLEEVPFESGGGARRPPSWGAWLASHDSFSTDPNRPGVEDKHLDALREGKAHVGRSESLPIPHRETGHS